MADTWHTKTALGFKIFLVQLILVLAPSWAYSQQLLSVASQSGAAGSIVMVSVQLSEGSGIAGLQFDLNLRLGSLVLP